MYINVLNQPKGFYTLLYVQLLASTIWGDDTSYYAIVCKFACYYTYYTPYTYYYFMNYYWAFIICCYYTSYVTIGP